MEYYELKILSDINCDVYLDYELKGTAKKNELTKFLLPKGEYHLMLVSTINSQYYIDEFIFIEYNRLYRACFLPLINEFPDKIQDSDVRMFPTSEGAVFRNLLSGKLLPGKFKTYSLMPSEIAYVEERYRFNNGRAIVEFIDGLGLSVIDINGTVMCNGYRKIYEFKEGLAAVCNNAGKWGFIDMDGKISIPCIYDEAISFSDGRAPVCIDDKWGCIDHNGNNIIAFIYDKIFCFRNRVAVVMSGNKRGIIDINGRIIIPIAYDDINNTENPNYFVVEKQGKQGLVNIYGRIIYPCIYERISICGTNDNLVYVKYEDEHFILANGKRTKIYGDYDTRYYDFYSENILVRYEDGDCEPCSCRIYFCDINGNPIMRPYDYTGYESDSYMFVNRGWNWSTYYRGGGCFGFVNHKGEEVIPCQYQNVHDFREGYAAVNVGGIFPPSSHDVEFTGGKWGFINTKGVKVCELIYDDVGFFWGGAAIVKKKDVYTYIDKYGNGI